MFKIVSSNQFKKDLKLAQKRGFKLELLTDVVNTLASGQPLDKKHRDHNLSGNHQGFREYFISVINFILLNN